MYVFTVRLFKRFTKGSRRVDDSISIMNVIGA